jgi:hypothetical protein
MTEYLQLIREDLNKLLPNLDIQLNNNELSIHDFGLPGLNITVDNRVILRLYKIKVLSPEDVSLYLQTKLTLENISNKYLNEGSIYLYPASSFETNKRGNFERRMWTIRVLKEAKEALDNLNREIS